MELTHVRCRPQSHCLSSLGAQPWRRPWITANHSSNSVYGPISIAYHLDIHNTRPNRMPLLQEVSSNSWAFDDDYPEGTEAQFEEALEFWRDGNEIKAEELLRSLLLVAPDHINALHHLAMIFASRGLEFEAYLSWREAVRVGMEGIPAEFSWHTGQMHWGHLSNRPFMRAYHAL
ncbi:hypothetical protein ALISP_4117 [Alicycliphilus sp. B1]|nr:hypothetical protein ALISP_4117 [Alicycliphilus sp. B1]